MTSKVSPEQTDQAKQFVFWTAVVIIGGFILLFVIPKLI
jgi:hypothetical protein